MLEAGMNEANDALDSDWSSSSDGNRHDYQFLRSDAPSMIFKAMLSQFRKENGI
jgi:hypothetical protein